MSTLSRSERIAFVSNILNKREPPIVKRMILQSNFGNRFYNSDEQYEAAGSANVFNIVPLKTINESEENDSNSDEADSRMDTVQFYSNKGLRRSEDYQPHISRDTPVSLYDVYNDIGYAAIYNSDMSANHAIQHRDKRKIFKLRNVALPLSIFHYLGFLPMRIPGMPYHIDPGLPDYTPYKPYNQLSYQEPPLRNRGKYKKQYD